MFAFHLSTQVPCLACVSKPGFLILHVPAILSWNLVQLSSIYSDACFLLCKIDIVICRLNCRIDMVVFLLLGYIIEMRIRVIQLQEEDNAYPNPDNTIDDAKLGIRQIKWTLEWLLAD